MFTKFFRNIHKFLGIPLSLVFVIWFLSGIVMVFTSDFPRAPRIDPAATPLKGDILLLDSLVASSLNAEDTPNSIIFSGRKDKILVTINSKDTCVVLDAITGEPYEAENLTPTDVAKMYCDAPISRIDTLEKVDQWIPFERYEKSMPIYKFYYGNPQQTQLYVTSSNEFIQITDKSHRIKAWFSTIPHWIYFTALRKHQKAWTETVIWAALLGCLMCVAGIIVAIIDWWHHARRAGLFSIPYRKRLWRWHFILGILFGWCCITFAFSGYMSMAPLPKFLIKERMSVYDSKAESAQCEGRKPRFRREGHNTMAPIENYSLSPADIIASSDSVIKISLKSWNGYPYYTVTYPSSTRNIDATHKDMRDFVLTTDLVARSVVKKFPDTNPILTIVEGYDSEYYPRKGRTLPLPGIKVEYQGDELNTVEYYDPNGLGVRFYDDNSRLHDMLYGKLHRLSFKILTDYSWLWYTVMLLLLLGGTSLSVTGMVMAVQWIIRKLYGLKSKMK
ncbi:MAG: PepSY domain-containing protein [Lachnospiraceae bacterium]|nr:PepSY domain-containing protein [Lachnospiraceae bacterium]